MAKFNTKNTELEFKKFADKVIHRAKFYLKRRKKNTKEANLSKSLDYDLKVYPSGGLELGFKAADYFPYVEEGRKPGKMPPVSAIAKYIGAYGVKPTWFFRDAFKMHYKRINKDIIAAYAKDVEKFMRITLKDNIK